MDPARYAVDAVVTEGRSLRSVASSLGMSKSWVAKQVTRFQVGGYESLVAQSTAPHRRPTQVAVELENEIVALRKQLSEEGFDAGPLTIQYHLRKRHGTAPGRSSIHRALVRRGFVVPQPQKRPRTSWVRFESTLPNETWQADMTHWSLADGTGVEILDFVDDYSRMVTVAVVLPVTTAADVVAAFYQGAGRFGLPASMLTDNGCIFTAQFRNGRCGFETELATLGITIKHGKPYHPQKDRALPPDAQALAAQTGAGHLDRRAPGTGRLLRPLLQRDPAPFGQGHDPAETGLRRPHQGRTGPGQVSDGSPHQGPPRQDRQDRGLHPALRDEAPPRGRRSGPQGKAGHRPGGRPRHPGAERGRGTAPPPHPRPGEGLPAPGRGPGADHVACIGSSVRDVAGHHTSGGSGIRTHGALRHNGFRDRPISPLSHPSKWTSAPVGCFSP